MKKERFIELDIARGLAIVFMILIHALEFFPKQSVVDSPTGEIIAFLGCVPAAPVFMMIMGAGVVFSRKNRPKDLLKRGIMIFLSGYLLNILRGTLPALLGWLILGDPSYLPYVFETLFHVDILQFAGLALMALALIGKLKLRNRWLIVLAVVLGAASTMLPSGGNQPLPWAALSGLFVGSSVDISYFPFLNWFIYPLAGYIFGTYLTRADDKTVYYRNILIGSALAFLLINAISLAAGLHSGLEYLVFDYHGNYLQHNLQHALSYVSFVLVWISFLHFASKKIPGWISETLQRWSRNVLEIYYLQWLLVVYGAIAIGFNQLNMFWFIIVAIGILVLSDLISFLYKGRWKPR